ncbi:MAG: ribbon-helix-helix protein, CopG family [Thermoplasmata archaeon]
MQPEGTKKPTISLRLPAELLCEVDALVQRAPMRSRTELIQRAVEAFLEEVKEAKVVMVRMYTEAEAEATILGYLEDHPGTYVSDLAEALGMNLDLAFRVVASLAGEGKVDG